ncbi:amidohydrolase family protein [Alkalihalobacillus trypoxylicola]|uniref:amidohydrolase family protein n=1 Tax=Alkalihalobacillus trypoxylicola TaxID=519424 RepID=UPI0007836B22|nr:amidohydrolase family protein [Alkalihalobacillus trypoxylicola]
MMQKIYNAKMPLLDETSYFDIEIKNGIIQRLNKHNQIEARDELSFYQLTGENSEQENGWDLEGRIVLPTFADIHMHLDKSHSLPFVGNDSGTLEEAIANYKSAAPQFSDEMIKNRIRKTAFSALKYGTTIIRTHIDFHTKSDIDTTFRGVKMALEVKDELKEIIEIQVYPMLPYHPYDEEDRKRIRQVLELNIDGVGGAPHISEKPLECVDEIFAFAVEAGLPLDLHTDESDDPTVDTVLRIAEKTIEYGWQGKVVVDHLCSLSAMNESKAELVINKMKEAELMAVTLPAANMYLQGRGDKGLVRRGITRVQDLIKKQVPLAAASDNVCDPFHPFGRADMLQIAQLTGYTAHMGGKEDLIELLKMATITPRKIIGKTEWGMREGERASFVVFDSYSLPSLFAELTESRAVFQAGTWSSVVKVNIHQAVLKNPEAFYKVGN